MEVNFSSLTKTESPPLVSENNQFLKVMTVLAQQNFLDMPDMDNLSLVNRYAYQRSRTIEMNPVHIKLSTTAKILAFKAAQYFWNEDDSEDEEQTDLRKKIILNLHPSEVALFTDSYFAKCMHLLNRHCYLQYLSDPSGEFYVDEEDVREDIISTFFYNFKKHNLVEHIVNLSFSGLIDEDSAIERKINKFIHKKHSEQGDKIYSNDPIKIEQLTKNLTPISKIMPLVKQDSSSH